MMSQFFAVGRKISKGKARAQQLRTTYWGHVPDSELWHRARHAGFTTIPRTMPIVMNIIDSLSKNQPAGRAYFGLWARAYDESVVILENPMSFAFEAGFTGERAVTTWRQRMHVLVELGFIEAKPGAAGPFHYVLVRNPHRVVWKLRPQIQEQLFMQLLDRAAEIGAADMEDPALREVKKESEKRTGKRKKSTGKTE